MNKYLIKVCILIIGVFSVLLSAKPTCGQGTIIHTKPLSLQTNQDIEISAMVEGLVTGVSSIRLLYNYADSKGYLEAQMENQGGIYSGFIPAEYARTGVKIKYLILAKLQNGTQISFPQDDPYEVPMMIQVTPESTGQSPPTRTLSSRQREIPVDNIEKLILAPAPNTSVSQDETLIAVTLFPLLDVDPSSIALYLDGANASAQAEISRDLITYRPERITVGSHTVHIQLSDSTGNRYEPVSWRFNVTSMGVQQTHLDFSGNVFVENGFYRLRNRLENVNKLGADVNVDFGSIDLNGSIYLTSKENPLSQPRNRYVLEVTMPGVNAELGDFYPRFTRLGMWGSRIRGLNTKLRLSPFNLQLVYGRSKRAIGGDLLSLEGSSQFPGYSHALTNYTFGRRVFGLKPSVGDGQNFEFGLSFISTRDDTLSVLNALEENNTTRIDWQSVTPKDNVVVGSELLLSFDKRRIRLNANAALSWKNNDIFGGSLSANDTLQLGTNFSIPVSGLPFDPSRIDRIFIINNNIQPFLPFPANVSRDPQDTTRFNLDFSPFSFNEYSSLAYDARLQLNYFNNTVSALYRRVGPTYHSFANPFLRQDVAGFELSDRLRLLRNKVNLTLSYEDLVEGLTREPNSQISSEKFSARVGLYLGSGYPTIQAHVNQYHRANALDSVRTITTSLGSRNIDNRVDNQTNSSILSISQPIYLFGLQHNARVNYMRSRKADQLVREPEYPGIGYALNLVAFELQSNFSFPLTTRISLSYNNNESRSYNARLRNYSVGGVYKLLGNNLIINGTLRMSQNVGTREFNRFGFASSFRYRFFKNHSVLADFQMISIDETDFSYKDYIYHLRYSYDF